MKIRCDICTVANKLSSDSYYPPAQFIHLSESHKISLLCEKCLPVSENELFYLPLSDSQDLDEAHSKYLSNITCNHDSPRCSDLKTMIETMFQTQIWEPFRQLETSIMAYRSTLTQYKKTVRSQYKALLSKLDPAILKNFKQIVIQIHQQSPALYKSSRVAVQKQELDLIITAMKISAQNSWSDFQKLIETTKKSYEKFKHVFINEKDQLNKKMGLLKKILKKINIEYQYAKKQPSSDQKRKRRENGDHIEYDKGNQIVLISQEDEGQSQKSNGSKKSNRPRNDNEETNKDFRKIKSKNFQCIELQEDSTPQQIIAENHQAKEIINGESQNGQNQVQQNPSQNPSDQEKKIDCKFVENIEEIIEQCVNQSAVNSKKNLLEQNQQNQTQNQGLNINEDQNKRQNQQKSLGLIQPKDINNSIKPINKQQPICLQIDLNDSDNQKTIVQRKSIKNHQLQIIQTYQQDRSQILLQKKSSLIQPPKNKPIPVISEYEYFEISVDNYMSPLEALKARLTTDFRIKRQLQKNRISINSLSQNQSTSNDYTPYLKILRRLKISYTRKKYLDQLLKFLPVCDNLEELTICEPLLATEDIISFIVRSIPKLRSLEFLCFNNLKEKNLLEIGQYLPNLEELYYGPKCYNNIALKSQYRQFRQHKKQKRASSLQNNVLIDFLKQMNFIKNIWISENNKMEQILFFLEQKSNFEHIIIGRYLTSQSSPNEISPQCWKSLTKLSGLYSIALINIKLDEKALLSILTTNAPTLKSVEIYNCSHWTDELASKLRYCRTLKEFYLFGSDPSIFKGTTLWQATSLETLVLRSCQFMDYGSAQRKIARLSQLKHIDLYGCEWFNDMTLSELVKNKQVTYLNLANTQIGSLYHHYLGSLFKIRCLALGSTRINAAAIQELCAQFSDMEKLSLYNLCGSPVVNGRCLVKKNRLNKLGDILTNLRYIDVASLNTADDTMFDHFKTIKTVYLWMATSISKKKIHQMYEKGVNIVDDA